MNVTMIRGHRLTEPRTPVTFPERPAWMLHPDRPCAGSDLWTSDDTTELDVAAGLCRTLDCPVLQECGRWAVENDVCWGAWGGLAFSGKQRTADRATTGAA